VIALARSLGVEHERARDIVVIVLFAGHFNVSCRQWLKALTTCAAATSFGSPL